MIRSLCLAQTKEIHYYLFLQTLHQLLLLLRMLLSVHHLELDAKHFLNLIDEVLTVQFHYIRQLLHQVYHIRKRKSLTLHDLLMVQSSQILQLLISVILGVIKSKLHIRSFLIPRHSQVGQRVRQLFLSDVSPFLLFGQNHHHNLRYFHLP